MKGKKELTIFYALAEKYIKSEEAITQKTNVEITGYEVLPCLLIKDCSEVEKHSHRYISKYHVCFWDELTQTYGNDQFVSEIFRTKIDAYSAYVEALSTAKTTAMFLKYEKGDLRQPEEAEVVKRTLALMKPYEKRREEKIFA